MVGASLFRWSIPFTRPFFFEDFLERGALFSAGISGILYNAIIQMRADHGLF